MDVCTAYLNSELSETVFMKQPVGYVNDSTSDKVLKLNKAIYGLKQSGREWHSKLDGALRDIGFYPCDNEPCLYKQDLKGNLCLILIYVDDLIIACQSKKMLESIKENISAKFECIDKGQLQLFLGMQIQRDGELGEMSVGQSQYIKDLLRDHKIEFCRTAVTPLDTGFQVACDKEDCAAVDKLYINQLSVL